MKKSGVRRRERAYDNDDIRHHRSDSSDPSGVVADNAPVAGADELQTPESVLLRRVRLVARRSRFISK